MPLMVKKYDGLKKGSNDMVFVPLESLVTVGGPRLWDASFTERAVDETFFWRLVPTTKSKK